MTFCLFLIKILRQIDIYDKKTKKSAIVFLLKLQRITFAKKYTMGLFGKLFGDEGGAKKENASSINWVQLTEISQLSEIEKESESQYIAILKHSTRCGISRMVLKMFESDYDLPESANVKMYFLDLIANREVSNAVADQFGVRHESPQLIVIHNREVVHHASHQSISAGKLKELV